jgi:carboxylesterase type B
MRSSILLGAMALAIRSTGAASPSVTIGAGTVQGGLCSNNTDAAYFKSIPFADPPLGDLRFAAPSAYSKKFPSGTLDGTKDPPSCVQFDPLFAEDGPASEDW